MHIHHLRNYFFVKIQQRPFKFVKTLSLKLLLPKYFIHYAKNTMKKHLNKVTCLAYGFVLFNLSIKSDVVDALKLAPKYDKQSNHFIRFEVWWRK